MESNNEKIHHIVYNNEIQDKDVTTKVTGSLRLNVNKSNKIRSSKLLYYFITIRIKEFRVDRNGRDACYKLYEKY